MNPSFFYLKRKAVVPIVIEPELQTAIDRIALNGWNTYPELQKIAVNNWIKRTKLNGDIFSTRTHIYLRGLGTTTESLIQASKINLKNPNGNLAIVSGGVTLTPNGYLYGGVNGYCDNRFNPTAEGLNINNFGILHDLMNDFPVNGSGLFGAEEKSPNRRLAFFPDRGGGVVENVSNTFYVNDFTSAIFSNPNVNKTLYIGRSSASKIIQANNLRSTNSVTALTPLINIDLYSGARNLSGTANFFCYGTERIAMFGGAMTEAEVNQQMLINNQYYTELGLPINS